MSRVLVTVGTTPFPRLIRFFDAPSRHLVTLQTADPGYMARHHPAIDFSPDIARVYDESDLVVTHAGAGSVYALLERGRRILVVPNLDRNDAHQRDLARFVRDRRHALVVDDLAAHPDADTLIEAALAFQAEPYVREPFTAAAALLRILRDGPPLRLP